MPPPTLGDSLCSSCDLPSRFTSVLALPVFSPPNIVTNIGNNRGTSSTSNSEELTRYPITSKVISSGYLLASSYIQTNAYRSLIDANLKLFFAKCLSLSLCFSLFFFFLSWLTRRGRNSRDHSPTFTRKTRNIDTECLPSFFIVSRCASQSLTKNAKFRGYAFFYVQLSSHFHFIFFPRFFFDSRAVLPLAPWANKRNISFRIPRSGQLNPETSSSNEKESRLSSPWFSTETAARTFSVLQRV